MMSGTFGGRDWRESRPEFVTPEIAKRLLDNLARNGGNPRRLIPHHVRKLAEDMRSGRWRDSTATLAIGTRDQVLDGQHRLAAVVAAGVGQWFSVCRGVPDSAVWGLDRNRVRSLHSFLETAGAKSTTTAVAIIRHWQGWVEGILAESTMMRGALDLEAAVDLYMRNEGNFQWATAQFQRIKSRFRGANSGVSGLVFLASATVIGKSWVESCVEKMTDRRDRDPGDVDPIYALATRLRAVAGHASRPCPGAIFFYWQRAFVAAMNGERLSRIQWNIGATAPPFPTVSQTLSDGRVAADAIKWDRIEDVPEALR